MTAPRATGGDLEHTSRLDEHREPAASQQQQEPHLSYAALIVRGTVALAFGLTLLAFGLNLSRLTTFVAIYWIVAALLTLRLVRSRPALRHRRLAFSAALIGLLLGVALLLRALYKGLLSEATWLDLLGATAIVTGVLRLAGLIHDDELARDGPRRRYRFVVGTLELWLGVAMIVAQGGASAGIRIALGLWGLAMGTFLLIDGLAVRRMTAHPRSTT